jgi:hypothetical protein
MKRRRLATRLSDYSQNHLTAAAAAEQIASARCVGGRPFYRTL